MSGRKIYDLGRPFTAHDVRKLRQCAICKNVGYGPQMLTLDGLNYHGGCIVASMTHEQVLALPIKETRKLRLNETGHDLMLKLLDRSSAEKGGA